VTELGLGLLSIGRAWGRRREPPPPEDAAHALLEAAVSLGIRVFDTAPAYGASETIFGRFLARIGATRDALFISTKMGESWDPVSDTSSVDHRYDTLKASIDASLDRLGRVDLLQLHKSNAQALLSADVARAMEYARSCGIRHFGASVSDFAAAEAASRTSWCSYLQFPFNRTNTALADIFPLARKTGMKLLINRPLAMGAIAASADAFAFVRDQDFSGVVLTGTKSIAHLRENCATFTVRR
jgi:aryl-alcohol dehydrogenase-like predicted oxidoreductase